MPRLLFSSYHCYLDPSSGAALSTRDLLELLTAQGWECRVLCGPQLDYETGESLAQVLGDHRLPYEVKRCSEGRTPFTMYHIVQGGVPIAVYSPPVVGYPFPSREEGLPFLALLERLLQSFRPDVLLTYGGSRLAREGIALAKQMGVRVAFSLRNFAYGDAGFIQQADAVLVPSRFSQEYYRQALGLTCTAIPGPFNWSRVCCPEINGRYVTFVNPQPDKGVFVFARIALELWRRRPDIPLLVVEGRGKIDWLARTGLDLGGVGNVHVMANTPDPRDFYRVTRLVLMPSLWNEAFARVPAESFINGIPVIGSTRGSLPEQLEQAGLLFDVPAQYTPDTRIVPTAEEAAPWVEAVIRLWDDREFYQDQRRRCLAAAEALRPEILGPKFEALLAPRSG